MTGEFAGSRRTMSSFRRTCVKLAEWPIGARASPAWIALGVDALLNCRAVMVDVLREFETFKRTYAYFPVMAERRDSSRASEKIPMRDSATRPCESRRTVCGSTPSRLPRRRDRPITSASPSHSG